MFVMAQVAGEDSEAWTSTTFCALGCRIFVGLGILFSLLRALLSPLKVVPGPFLARFTDLWYLSKLYQGRFEVENLRLHERYGEYQNLRNDAGKTRQISNMRT